MKQSAFAILITAVLTSGACAAETATLCDTLAAHPSDPDKIAPGLHEAEMDKPAAQAACEAAVAKDANNRRLRYQLGRAYFYDGKFDKAMPHLEFAADKGSSQAQFVLGYILDGGLGGQKKDACKVEDLWAKSARQGRFAAQTSYAHHVFRGLFKGCTQQAGTDEIGTFLMAAKKQADGYFQKLLVSMLTEEFTAYQTKH